MATTSTPSSAHTEKHQITAKASGLNSSNASTNIPSRNVAFQPPSRYQTRHSLELDDYFAGPRDMQKHSKLPFFMRVHGSVMPKMILPLIFVGVWATALTCISKYVYKLAIDTVLLTVLGFVVAFGLSFRCSTAYERYNDGRKYWSQLTLTCRNLARLVWLNVEEREDPEQPELTKRDLLGKISALNLINAYTVALKHRLRFEPAVDYPDISYLVEHIDATTMASKADQSKLRHQKPSALKQFGENLGVTFAQSNPRKLIKRAEDNLGNLPNEILAHLSAYTNKVVKDGQVPVVCTQNLMISDIRILADVLTGCERVLNTPLPLAYSISISQITWAYIMVLPFQLFSKLDWVTIPATMVAAYIILGLAMIGREIENPFGNDVNDLPMEMYCTEIAADIDVLTSVPYNDYKQFVDSVNNRPLYPLSYSTATEWESQSIDDIRDALRAKATTQQKTVQIQRAQTFVANIETV